MATRVLLVDDNPQDRLLIRRALAAEFPDDLEIAEVVAQPQLDGALRQPEFDIVITDFQLRWTDGLKVLEAVQSVVPDIPVEDSAAGSSVDPVLNAARRWLRSHAGTS